MGLASLPPVLQSLSSPRGQRYRSKLLPNRKGLKFSGRAFQAGTIDKKPRPCVSLPTIDLSSPSLHDKKKECRTQRPRTPQKELRSDARAAIRVYNHSILWAFQSAHGPCL